MMPTARTTALLAASVCTLGLAFATSAAADHDPHACERARAERSGASLDPATPLIRIELLDREADRACGHPGIHVDVEVPEALCVHVGALGRESVADARAHVPCPRWDGFKDCAAAHTVGAHDIPKGDKRYRGYLDEDGDGVACESQGEIEQPTAGVVPGAFTPAPTPRIIAHDLIVTH